jgi:hypothetical protein
MLKPIVARVDRALDLLERLASALETIAKQPPQPITIHQTTPLPASNPAPRPNPFPQRGPNLPAIQPWQPYSPGPGLPYPNGPLGPIWSGNLPGGNFVPLRERDASSTAWGGLEVKTDPRAEPGTAAVGPTTFEKAADNSAPATTPSVISGYFGSSL